MAGDDDSFSQTGSGRGGIPSWQLAETKSDPSHHVQPGSSETTSNPGLRESDNTASSGATKADNLAGAVDIGSVERAKRFLRSENLEHKPIQDKIAFLEGKGLERHDIDLAMEQMVGDTKPTHSANQDAPKVAQKHVTAPIAARKDEGPPIITYPEFLMHAQKPPPLVTAHGLMNTVYTVGGLGALIYGFSQYIVHPLTESLTDARHQLSEHTQSHLAEMNEKLAQVASVDPMKAASAKHASFNPEDFVSEAGTEDSDPTELFHRDFGTQTLPLREAVNGAISETSSEDAITQLSPVEAEAGEVRRIARLCESLVSGNSTEGESLQEISTTVKVLNEYLESLAYAGTSLSMGPFGSSTYGGSADSSKKGEIGKMKAEIRSFKGVLLSARNFPSSGTRSPHSFFANSTFSGATDSV